MYARARVFQKTFSLYSLLFIFGEQCLILQSTSNTTLYCIALNPKNLYQFYHWLAPYIEIENIKFLTGLGTSLKETAVAGLLQVTCKEPLKILKRFCLRDLNITKIKNSASLQCLQEEIPPFLDMLEQIRKEEKADFLPRDVSTIVLMLLRIRSQFISGSEF